MLGTACTLGGTGCLQARNRCLPPWEAQPPKRLCLYQPIKVHLWRAKVMPVTYDFCRAARNFCLILHKNASSTAFACLKCHFLPPSMISSACHKLYFAALSIFWWRMANPLPATHFHSSAKHFSASKSQFVPFNARSMTPIPGIACKVLHGGAWRFWCLQPKFIPLIYISLPAKVLFCPLRQILCLFASLVAGNASLTKLSDVAPPSLNWFP